MIIILHCKQHWFNSLQLNLSSNYRYVVLCFKLSLYCAIFQAILPSPVPRTAPAGKDPDLNFNCGCCCPPAGARPAGGRRNCSGSTVLALVTVLRLRAWARLGCPSLPESIRVTVPRPKPPLPGWLQPVSLKSCPGSDPGQRKLVSATWPRAETPGPGTGRDTEAATAWAELLSSTVTA